MNAWDECDSVCSIRNLIKTKRNESKSIENCAHIIDVGQHNKCYIEKQKNYIKGKWSQ